MVMGKLIRCSKCGLIQTSRPACSSCNTALDGQPAAQPGPGSRSGAPRAGTDGNQIHKLSFHGSGGSLFGIQIVNVFLILITLGIYFFWGKAKVRRYLLSETEFEGDRFAYHGTGRELLIGFLKAGLVFGAISALFKAAPYLPGGIWARVAAIVVAEVLLLIFVPVAMVGARRYRLSRISWRGIRFSFRGRVAQFIKLFIGGAFLTGLTFGLYYPIFAVKQYGFMVSHSYFGNQKFDFDGRGRDLFGSFVLTYLLTMPTLGFIWVWFLAKKQRYLWDHTSCGTARFHSTVMGRRVLLLKLTNLFLVVATLGFGWPWAMVRNVRFALRYLTLEGSLALASIQQDAQAASPTGEGLDSLMGLDTGLGVG